MIRPGTHPTTPTQGVAEKGVGVEGWPIGLYPHGHWEVLEFGEKSENTENRNSGD